MTADEMAGWHHRLNGHEFEQVLGVGDEQRSLLCCSPLDMGLDLIDRVPEELWMEVHDVVQETELDMTEQLN